MTYAELILPEFDQEMASTRKVLALVPDDKLEWKAHDKAHSIGWNASHLAEIAGWTEGTIHQAEWDLDPPGGEPYRTPALKSRQEILERFDRNVAAARKSIQEVSDNHMQQNWSLLVKGKSMLTMPRAAVIRGFVINHTVHHRAVLIVYLRLNGIAVPGMYGPGDPDAEG